jgi:methionine synthase II (cobalamin-independent)
MPHKDAAEAARLIAARTTLPFWPQLVNLGPQEDIVLQCAQALPCLEVDLAARRVVAGAKGREEELFRFYERLLAGDLEHFAPQVSRGLDALLETVRGLAPEAAPRLLKGQVVGPVTFGTTVKEESGRDIIHDRELMEACCQGLAMKAAWQARRLNGAGAEAIIFFDEPSLSGFGSAFMPVGRDSVLGLLRLLFDTFRSAGQPALLGLHCCGNSDWPMLLESGTDIISFDSWSYLDNFCLFPREIDAFLRRGGYLAWGAVPTIGPVPENWAALAERLSQGLASLEGSGVDKDLLLTRSLLTPSCGMGLLSEPEAARVLDALGWLREHLLQAP